MANFSDIIKKLRDEKGYGQETLAEELGVSKSTIAMWETGKRFPSKELYEQIADLFNVDIDYLYGRTEIRKKHHFDYSGEEYINTNYISEEATYYLNEETRQIAQEIFDNPDLRILFDASRKASPEDLKFIVEMAKRFKGID